MLVRAWQKHLCHRPQTFNMRAIASVLLTCRSVLTPLQVHADIWYMFLATSVYHFQNNFKNWQLDFIYFLIMRYRLFTYRHDCMNNSRFDIEGATLHTLHVSFETAFDTIISRAAFAIWASLAICFLLCCVLDQHVACLASECIWHNRSAGLKTSEVRTRSWCKCTIKVPYV